MPNDRRASRRRPPAIVSSAEIITARKLDRLPKPAAWEGEAWAFYDTVGEVRQATGWLGNAMSRCRLAAARKGRGGDEPTLITLPDPDDPEDDAEPLTRAEQVAAELVERLAGGTEGQAQLLADFAVPLSVPGIAYLVGEPDDPGPEPDEAADRLRPEGRAEEPAAHPERWQVFSADVIGKTPGPVAEGETEPRFTIRTGEGRDDVRTLSADALVVRVWRGHKRWHWQPDSPMRAVLGPLRRLALFADHLEASGVSRLAGAGILVLPEEMTFASSEKNKDAADPFIADFIDTMTTAISDRDNASAVVPLVVRVKGDLIEKIRHITFFTEFQAEVDQYIDKELRRFATGMDLPAEIVLGLAQANHWTAWQIEESGLKLHVEPMLEAVCSALTTGYLRAGLEAAGISPQEAADLLVWFDASELTVRPDRSGDAGSAYERRAIGGRAYRREIGMAEEDAPDEEEFKRLVIMDVIKGAPSLAPLLLRELGIKLSEAVPDVLPEPGGRGDASPDDGNEDEGGEGGPPGTRDEPPPPPGEDAALEAALLAAADQMVYRALERAGARMGNALRSADIRYTGPHHLAHAAVPEEVRASCLASGGLLDGAWDRVPEVAARYRVEPEALRQALDGYTRGLIAAGWPHEYDGLRSALGAVAP